MSKIIEVYFEAFRDRDNQIHILSMHGKKFEAHFHSNIEVMYVASGEMEVSIGGEKRNLTKGSVAVAESYVVHSLSVPEDADIRVAIIPIIRVPDYSLIHRNLNYASPFLEPSAHSESIGTLFRSFEHYRRDSSPMIGKGFAYLLLGMLTDALGTVPSHQRNKDGVAVVGQMLRYMDEHYTEPLTLDTLARELYLSKFHISHVFAKRMGISFPRFLGKLRVDHACKLLEKQASVTQAAFAAGFSSVRTFNRTFQKEKGLSPREYKKQIP